MLKLALALLLLLALTAQPLAAIVPVVEDSEDEFLVVRSNGFSRFEIENGDILANMTGGVEFEYLGYRLLAEEVRYNHATRVASASGSVSMAAPGFGAVSDEVKLDGLAGSFSLSGNVAGNLQEQSLSFSADSVEISLPPGQSMEDPGFDTAQIVIAGNVRASVPQYGSFAADSISYDGTSGELSIPEEFSATLMADSLGPELEGYASEGAEEVVLRGDSLSGRIHQRRGLEYIEVLEPRITTGGGELSGALLSLREVGTTQKPAWRVSMDGAPVRGSIMQDGEAVNFSSDEIVVMLDNEGLRNLSLTGAVRLSGSYAEVSAQEVWIVRRSDGMQVTRGRGLNADFNLAQLTGTEPIEFSSLTGSVRD